MALAAAKISPHYVGRLLSEHRRPPLKKGDNFMTPEWRYSKRFGANTPDWKTQLLVFFPPACCDSGADGEDAHMSAWAASHISPCYWLVIGPRPPQYCLSTLQYTEVFTDSLHTCITVGRTAVEAHSLTLILIIDQKYFNFDTVSLFWKLMMWS